MGNVLKQLGAWCAPVRRCLAGPTADAMSEGETRHLLAEAGIADDTVTTRPSPSPLQSLFDPTRQLVHAIRPRTPKRRALLIGICYNQCGGDLESLKGPHKDVMDVQKLLIAHCGYSEENVVLMMDTPNAPADLKPTKVNIKRQMGELVKDAQPGDRFVFVFSGHSDQKVEKQEDNAFPEEDGMDEVILTMDNKIIRDNTLYKTMVLPLPPGAGLFALLDSCHSGTMLDLPHNKCNAVYVPWISKGKRRTGTLRMKQVRGMAYNASQLNMPSFTRAVEGQNGAFEVGSAHVPSPSATYKLRLNTSIPSASLPSSDVQSVMSKSMLAVEDSSVGEVLVASPVCDSPDVQIACTGWCHHDEAWKNHHPDVISLSACTDLQQAWEDSKGRSLIHLFCEYTSHHIKSQGKQPTYKELMTYLNYQLYHKSMQVHRWTMRRKQQAKSAGTSFSGFGEAVNFQTPELSSITKLDINESLRI